MQLSWIKQINTTRRIFISDFFDLKTGIAGEILQKFSTYNVRLAILGDFQNIKAEPC
ncbi:MAG: DUF4180 domain-containing protein [Ignavibacteriales bacterium]|nr:DUF4180 domain-containing protein [Ignavibacteriales bacterium]